MNYFKGYNKISFIMIDTYFGFDVGTKRTGIAIANSLTNSATGLAVIEHPDTKFDWLKLDELIKDYKPKKIIVGVPLQLNNEMQTMIFIARAFCKKLFKRYGLEVIEVDEYLSSNEAKKQLKYNHSHQNANRSEVDKQSAAVILQTWLNG
jgi:putative Holliday junction resolvase